MKWTNFQLVRQYPSSFEFTGHYLERLVEGVYSAGFLNFAGERAQSETSPQFLLFFFCVFFSCETFPFSIFWGLGAALSTSFTAVRGCFMLCFFLLAALKW